jgi:ParB family transcriptional regulator, chromosome partitioning protein
MSKREELLRSGGGNILSSMGTGQNQELPTGLDPATALRRPAHLEGLTREKAAARITVDRIVRDPDQPREEFDEEALQRLADSLRTRGQLQPIRVRWDEGRGAYVILVGERRWRAAQQAGLTELSCIVVDGELPPDERLMIQLVENALREDLRPVEQARAYKALMEAREWSGNQLAKELHIAQSSVVRALALLELPAPVQAQVEQGALAATVAAELTKLPESAMQAEVAQAIVDQGLTRSEVAEVVKAVRARRPAQTRPDPVEVDLGDGITVVVRYRKPTTVTAQQALRKALKVLQDRDRDDQAA